MKHAGVLDGFEISREEAEALIMTARVKAGWIEAVPEPDRTAETIPFAKQRPANRRKLIWPD